LRKVKDLYFFILCKLLLSKILKTFGRGHRYLKVEVLGCCTVAERPFLRRLVCFLPLICLRLLLVCSGGTSTWKSGRLSILGCITVRVCLLRCDVSCSWTLLVDHRKLALVEACNTLAFGILSLLPCWGLLNF
jgi:hypothetical protein